MTLGLSSAEDCMSEWYNLRCKPKAEAGKYGQHPALFQDGDPCFTLAPYGTICYVGTKTQKFDYCSVSSPGCYDFGCRFSNQTRVGPFKKSCLEWPRTNNMGAGGHPEHFEPKQRSVAAIAIHRMASKVLASQY